MLIFIAITLKLKMYQNLNIWDLLLIEHIIIQVQCWIKGYKKQKQHLIPLNVMLDYLDYIIEGCAYNWYKPLQLPRCYMAVLFSGA
jgi:hypothetical protein